MPNVQYLIFLKSDTPFDLLIYRLPDIIQKSFCTRDGAMDLTFQINYVPAFWHVFSEKTYAKTAVHFC